MPTKMSDYDQKSFKMADMEESEGDSSKSLLANLERCSEFLMKEELHKKKLDDETQRKSTTLESLKRKREHLSEELIRLEAENQLREQLIDSNESTGQIQRGKDLQHELTKVKKQYYQDMKLLECLQQGECLRNQLFQLSNSSHPTAIELESLLSKQVELVRDILVSSKEGTETREELARVRKERMKCVENCRDLSEKLEEDLPKEDILPTTENSDSQQSRVDYVSKQASLLSHSLQCLIVGSGVDWTRDPELLELTIKLGNVKY